MNCLAKNHYYIRSFALETYEGQKIGTLIGISVPGKKVGLLERSPKVLINKPYPVKILRRI
jgi:hypothetical protein